jgi:hypothetical protein
MRYDLLSNIYTNQGYLLIDRVHHDLRFQTRVILKVGFEKLDSVLDVVGPTESR